MKFKIIFPILAMILFLSLIPIGKAFSIGISPAEKTIEVEENQQAIVYFAVSQGMGTENQSIEMSPNVNWLVIEPQSFELEPAGQRYVKVTVMPLSVGNYTAKIIASASIPGMRISMSAILNVYVVKPSELEETERRLATDAINSANSVITEARKVGVNTTNAEVMLARAMEEFEKRNYVYARDLAQIAYNLALDELNRIREAKSILFPIEVGLIFIIIWGSLGLVATVYELVKALRKRKAKLQIVKDKNCPECGKPMGKTFDGSIVQAYICPSCGRREIKTR